MIRKWLGSNASLFIAALCFCFALGYFFAPVGLVHAQGAQSPMGMAGIGAPAPAGTCAGAVAPKGLYDQVIAVQCFDLSTPCGAFYGISGGSFQPTCGSGASAQVTVAVDPATVTLPPGSAASVVNTGTPSAAVFKFSLPAGQPGTNGIANFPCQLTMTKPLTTNIAVTGGNMTADTTVGTATGCK